MKRKFLLISMCAAVMFFSSCSKEDNNVDAKEVNNQTEVNATKAITVSAKQKSSVSKVALGNENQGKYEEVFSEGEVLKLYLNGDEIASLDLTDGAGTTSATFSGEIPLSADGKTISAKILPKETPSGLTECSSFAAAVSTFASLYGEFNYDASAERFSVTLDDEVSYFVVETNKFSEVDINGNNYTVSNNSVVFAFNESLNVSSTALELNSVALTAGGNVYFKTLNSILVTSITLSEAELEITEGKTATLSVTSVLPDNADDKTYTWTSDNERIATVDENGVVTAVNYLGVASIRATANDGSGVYGECNVSVREASSETITLSVGYPYWDYTQPGEHFEVSGFTDFEGKLKVDNEHNMTISAKNNETIVRVVFTVSEGTDLMNFSVSAGTVDGWGSNTVKNVNASSLTVSPNGWAEGVFTGVTIYYVE